MLDYVSLTSTFSTLTAVKGHCRADQYLEAVVGVDGAGDPRWGAHKMAGLVPHHTLLWGSSEPGRLATSRVNGRIHEEGRQTIWKYSTGNLFPCFFGTFQNSLIKKYKGSTPLKNYSFKYLQKQLWYITVYEQILQWKHLWTVPVIFTSTRTHVHLPKFVSSILHLTYLTVN